MVEYGLESVRKSESICRAGRRLGRSEGREELPCAMASEGYRRRIEIGGAELSGRLARRFVLLAERIGGTWRRWCGHSFVGRERITEGSCDNVRSTRGGREDQRTRTAESLDLLYVYPGPPAISESFLSDEFAELVGQGVRAKWFAVNGVPGGGVGRVVEAQVREMMAELVVHPGRVVHWLRLALRERGSVPNWVLRRSVVLAATATRESACYLHSHFIDDPAVATMLASALCGLPWSATAHAKDIFRSPQTRLVRLANEARIVVTVCKYNKVELAAFGVPSEKIAVVPCGVPMSLCAVMLPRDGSVYSTERDKAGLQIASVGRLVEKKGFEYLLTAVSVLRAEGYEVYCTIVGDGPLAESLKLLAAELGISGAVKFTGKLRREDALRIVAGCDVFCLPCCIAHDGDRDSMPVAIKEAMALGVPIVSTTEVGIPELVSARSGRLVPPRSSAALAVALASIVDDPETGRKLGENALREVDCFSLCRTVAAFRELLFDGVRPLQWSE